MLADEENFALARINRQLIGKVEAIDAQQRIVLDMGSTEIPVYGQQETAPTTPTSSLPAITRCCHSIGRATAWRQS